MKLLLLFSALASGFGALAQVAPPPGQPGAPQSPAAPLQAPRGTQQTAPVPQPGNLPVPNAQQAGQAAAAPISLTLPEALQRAGLYSQQVYSARFTAMLAHEDAVQ